MRNVRLQKLAKKLGREYVYPNDYYTALQENDETDVEMIIHQFNLYK